MKILFIVTGLGVGGAERQVVDLADCMAAKGCKISIISLTGATVTRPASLAVDVYELSMVKSLPSLFLGLVKAIQIVQHVQPDILHGHMIHANLFARILRIMSLHVPLVCTAHTTNQGSWKRMLALRITDSLASINTNVSKKAVEASIRRRACSSRRITHIYNGIRADDFAYDPSSRHAIRASLGIPIDQLVYIFVGRLVDSKNIPNLFLAFNSVLSNCDSSLLIVGTGPLHDQLVSMSEEMGLSRKILFIGASTHVQQLLSASDIFVLPSSWEGFSLVVAEAMANKRLVVATDSGGVAEVLGSNIGWLVPPNSSQSLACAMLEAASCDDIAIAARTERGTQRVYDKFTIEKAVSAWELLYRGLLKSKA